ncbi:MAG: dephospho-CoA kinase [bacterium]|nr:dephospho-CoA kinase [bacterium]
MKCFALTGGIASGKSTVSALLKQAGIPVIDADVLSRQVVVPNSIGLTKISRVFGKDYLDEHGQLNRNKMAQLIFSDPSARKKLEDIIHPLVAMSLQAELVKYEENQTPFVVYEAPLIFEKGLEKLFDATILVVTSEEEQLKRLIDRDKISEEQAKKRIAAQMSDENKKTRTQNLIDNSGTPESTLKQMQILWFRLTGKNLLMQLKSEKV